MKTRDCSERRFFGFTLMEMVGVLAVVGILTTLLVPRIMAAIADADLAADVLSIKSVRSAAEDYFRRYGQFGLVGGAAIPASQLNHNAYEYWDQKVLLPEQLLEKPFVSRLANNCYIRVITNYYQTASGGLGSAANPLGTGTYGSLGSQYCNNGAYDLTQEYAANSRAPRELNAYALGRAPALFQAPAWADWLVSLAGKRGAALRAFDGVRSVASAREGSPRNGSRFASVRSASPNAGSGWLARLRESVRRPIEAIVLFPPRNSVPSSTPPPTPGEGAVVSPPGTSASHTGSDLPNTCHNDAASSSYGVEIVLQGVSLADAYRLSLAIDGPTQSNWAYWDSQGRVKYDFANAQVGNVFIYVACK